MALTLTTRHGAFSIYFRMSFLVIAVILAGCEEFQKLGATREDLVKDQTACEIENKKVVRRGGRPRLPMYVYRLNQCLSAKGWVLATTK